MPSPSARVEHLEAGKPDALVDFVDRPPRETRDEWIERMAHQLRGEPFDNGARNAYGETRTEWTARRRRELAMAPP